ncbi:MAG: glycerol kinase GlpK [Pseudomonadota bacterium]|nr:glycerol kinase GlpK [Pseudomonadota bacterium]
MHAILAIDQGTTSTRVIVFSKTGDILCQHQKEHRQIYPQSGWVEHDAEEIFNNTVSLLKAALQDAQLQGIHIKSIGITNQRETIVCFDKQTGAPLHNALVWQDTRTEQACQKLHRKHGIEIQQKTGLPVNPYFSASKLKWLMENVQAVQTAKSEKRLLCGTMECYLLYRLTGGQSHKSDVTNACRTQLLNIHTLKWDPELLELFKIPSAILPQVTSNSEEFGHLNIAKLPPLPIYGMIGDQQAALFGQACFKQGYIKSTYGTGCFAMLNTGQNVTTSENGLLTTVGYQVNNQTCYALEGSVFIAGAVVQWLRDQLGLIHHAKETEALAKESLDADDLCFIPAFTGLGAPHWQSAVKASISGMTLSTTKADLVRAALDGVCLQTYDLISAFEEDAKTKVEKLKVDGGMTHNSWFSQRLADLVNITVEKPKMVETTALGAAYMAGLKCGLYQSLDDIERNNQVEQTLTPQMTTSQLFKKYSLWQKSLEKA